MTTWKCDCGGSIRITVKTNEQQNKQPIHEEPTVAQCDRCGKWAKGSQLEGW